MSAASQSATASTPKTSFATSDAEIVEKLEQRLQFAELKIQLLEERLRQMLIKKYGASSEKLPSAQLELLDLEPGVSSDEVEAESEHEPLPPQPEVPEEQADRKPGRKHPGRQSLPAHLPPVEKIVACTPEQCKCGGCGG